MKISSSQTQLSGRQSDSVTSMKLQRLSVQDLTSDQPSNQNYDRASIILSLTNKVSEQQSIRTQSSISKGESGLLIEEYAALEIAKHVVEQGSEVKITVSEVSQPVPANLIAINGIELTNSAEVKVEVVSLLTQESRQNLTFEALGQISTEDGRNIDFLLALDFERSVETEQINRFVGNRNLIDPLMINISGGTVGFTDLTFEFDLNVDGRLENIAQTAKGSGFLVFDKNQNGVVDDGSEMFGPESGHGFAELGQYDDDGNGWIDENDAIYSQLSVMSFSPEGREIQSLITAEVGAIFLGSVASDYDVNTESGLFVGKIKQSGAALAEDGRVLLMQEVHLVDYSDGQKSRGRALDVIGEIESPLSLFQFNDPIIAFRDVQTSVTLSTQEEFNVGVNVSVQLSQEPLFNNGLEKQTFDRAKVALELSEWVANAMEDFEPRVTAGAQVEEKNLFSEISQVKAPVFDQALASMDLEDMKLESKLATMRSMIESLREMRQAMDNSSYKISLYNDVGKF